jgi:hypothetical protein
MFRNNKTDESVMIIWSFNLTMQYFFTYSEMTDTKSMNEFLIVWLDIIPK